MNENSFNILNLLFPVVGTATYDSLPVLIKWKLPYNVSFKWRKDGWKSDSSLSASYKLCYCFRRWVRCLVSTVKGTHSLYQRCNFNGLNCLSTVQFLFGLPWLYEHFTVIKKWVIITAFRDLVFNFLFLTVYLAPCGSHVKIDQLEKVSVLFQVWTITITSLQRWLRAFKQLYASYRRV